MSRFLEMCDQAYCAPDFPVVHHMTDDEAVEWLALRLRMNGYPVPQAEVAAAMKEWDERPRGAEHDLGVSIRLVDPS